MIDLIFNSSIVSTICWTVIHSLWQFTIIGIACYFILQNIAVKDTTLRYNTLLLSMTTCIVGSILTFIYYIDTSVTTSSLVENFSGTSIPHTVFNEVQITISNQVLSFIHTNHLLITTIWFTGFILLLLKMVFSYWYIIRLNKLATQNFNKNLANSLISIKNKLGINKKIQLKWSDNISTPMVTGWITPIILFPISCINQLTIAETEAILAHELAHVKRNDFIVNAFQSMTEILFYYHPMIWWLSSLIREEREHCCDQIAINSIDGDALCYAKTLLKIEEINSDVLPTFSMGFISNKEHLLERISRILNHPKYINNMKTNIVSLVLICIIFCGFTYAETSNFKYIKPVEKIEKFVAQIVNSIKLEKTPKLKSNRLISLIKPIFVQADTITPKEVTEISKYNIIENGDEESEINIEENNGITTVIIKKQSKGLKSIDTIIIPNTNNKPFIIGEEGDYIIFEDSIIRQSEYSSNSFFTKNGIKIDSLTRSLILRSKGLQDQMKEMEIRIDLDERIQSGIALVDELDLDAIMQNIEIDLEGILENIDLPENIESLLKDKNIDIQINNRINNRISNEVSKKHKKQKLYNYNNKHPYHYFHHKNDNPTDLLLDRMYQDRLLVPGVKNKIKLTGKKLKINGKTQDKTIWREYKKYYEELLGTELTRKSKIEFNDFRSKNNVF